MTKFTLSRRTLLAAMSVSLAARCFPAIAQTPRPSQWAVPLTLAGVPNFFQVTPRIYRSAQPTAAGFQGLAKMGIETVINLRRRVDDAPLAKGTDLTTLHIKITTRHITDDDGAAIVTALRNLRQAQRQGAVLVHCTHGADRTGLIIALWRMLYQQWPRAAAIAELHQGGYGFHEVWVNIPAYLKQVDLTRLKDRVGE